MSITLFRSYTVGLLAIILLSGSIVFFLTGCGLQTVKGSGNVVTESRSVPEFDQIRLEGQGKVILTRGANHFLIISTDDNILPHIETSVRNRKLIISHGDIILSPSKLSFAITLSDLKGAAIAGSGDIKGSSRFFSDDFYAEISGSGSIDLELETTQLQSEISGSGSINLSGLTDHHRARLTGSGKIYTVDMQSIKASVTITGSGNCHLTASDHLKVKITGSGDVLYKGRPRIDQTITGSG